MDREMLDYYRVTMLLLSAVGLRPYEKEKLRLHLNVVVSSIITGCIIVQLTPYASGKATKQDILKSMSFILMTLGVVAKYFIFMHQIQVIRELLEGINRDWKTADDEELKIIKEHAYMGKRYSMFFAGEGYTCDETVKIYMLTRLRKTPVTVFIFLSTFGVMAHHFFSAFLNIVLPLNETRLYKSPIVTELFIDEQKYYFRIAILQDLAILILGIVCVATETFTFMWMMHGACLYRLVSYRINVAVLDCINDSYGTVKAYNRNRREGVMRVILMHNRAYTFFKDLMSAITLVYSILFILGVTSLSTNLYTLSTSVLDEGNIGNAMISLLFIIAEIIYLFYINYIIQQLIDCCDDVFTAVYNTEWYKTPVTTQKLLLFIMLKSIVTPDCKVLFVCSPSIEFFSKLLRTSVSYFMVMTSIQ